MISLIKIRRANPAAVRMLGAESAEELYESLERVHRSDSELEPFVQQFAAVWDGRRELALDLAGLTIEGAPFEGVLHWSVPTTQGKPDLARVIVTISDIAPRRVVEDQLAAALEANQQLLDFRTRPRLVFPRPAAGEGRRCNRCRPRDLEGGDWIRPGISDGERR